MQALIQQMTEAADRLEKMAADLSVRLERVEIRLDEGGYPDRP